MRRLLLLHTFRTIFGASLITVCYTLGIQCAADDMVTYTRQVTYTSAANQNNGVLLQVVADTRNVTGSLHAVGKANFCNLTKRGVRLFGVVVVTLVHTPRFCGACWSTGAFFSVLKPCCRTGALDLYVLSFLPCFTSWLKVGMIFLLSIGDGCLYTIAGGKALRSYAINNYGYNRYMHKYLGVQTIIP